MTTSSKRVCAFLSVLLLTAGGLSAAPPAITIQKATELAQKALEAKGKQKEVFIESIALRRTSVLDKAAIWVVTWSGPVPGVKPGSKEVGLEIDMRGEVVHLIKGRTSKALIR